LLLSNQSAFFPFFLIPRSVYLYHYLFPFIFGCMAAGAAVELVCQHPAKGIKVVALSALALVGFYLWSPLSDRTTHLDMSVIMWTNRWRWGAPTTETRKGKHPPRVNV
jgi:dolichyl-phosphate-mannose--protein O-mannosyl transferase